MSDQAHAHGDGEPDEERRDFLYIATGAFAAVGAAATLWPFINALNPSADALAESTAEVDLSDIEEGQSVTVVWRKRPVFIRRRTAPEIEQAAATPVDDLPDPEPDADRVLEPQWLVVVGVCTHLGCIPLGQKAGENRGDFGGWFCPCHGSHYDTSGRIRRGPAPANLVVPEYAFLTDSTIRIG